MRIRRATAGTLAIVAATLLLAIADSPSALVATSVDGGTGVPPPEHGGAAPPFVPERFASAGHTAPGALAADGATLYLTRSALDFSRSRILRSRRTGEGWDAPEPLFDDGHADAGPALAPDGATLYFHSDRATGLDGVTDAWNLFAAERRGDGWSAPRALPAPLNGPKSDCCVAPAPDGSLLFASDRHGSWDVWRGRPDGDRWTVEKLPEGINSSFMEWPSAVDVVDAGGATTERLLMSSIRPPGLGGLGGDDLYVAFRPRGDGGAWSAPRNLGPRVNGPGYEDSARLTPDGALLLFASRPPDGASTVRAIATSSLDLAPPPSAEAALRAADEALGAAWSARDVGAMMALYAPEARAHWSSEPARDREAIRALWTRDFADPGYAIDGRELGRWLSASGDLAVVHGVSTVHRGAGASRRSSSGSWSTVWRRIDGDWRIVLESFVGEGPPRAPDQAR